MCYYKPIPTPQTLSDYVVGGSVGVFVHTTCVHYQRHNIERSSIRKVNTFKPIVFRHFCLKNTDKKLVNATYFEFCQTQSLSTVIDSSNNIIQ